MKEEKQPYEQEDNLEALKAIVEKLGCEESMVVHAKSKEAIVELKNLIHDEAIRLSNANSKC